MVKKIKKITVCPEDFYYIYKQSTYSQYEELMDELIKIGKAGAVGNEVFVGRVFILGMELFVYVLEENGKD